MCHERSGLLTGNKSAGMIRGHRIEDWNIAFRGSRLYVAGLFEKENEILG
jgi:hypothetical protein